MNKNIWILVALGVVIVLLVAVLFWPTTKPVAIKVNNNPQAGADIEVSMPKEGDWVSSPLTITGVVRGNGWSGFEGQVGNVILLDSNGKQLASTGLQASTDWTKLPTSFDITIEFNPGNSETGTLVFHNENPSGIPANAKEFVLPIKFALGK